LIHPAAFRQKAYRRRRRQALTLARAVGAGRAREAAARREVTLADGQALRDLAATVAADARLVMLPVDRPP